MLGSNQYHSNVIVGSKAFILANKLLQSSTKPNLFAIYSPLSNAMRHSDQNFKRFTLYEKSLRISKP